jgi:bifunctional UDP-N-acetylglucosamine pyrophosphorylase/glucosamine-1-phosphate N-acetyltransferase
MKEGKIADTVVQLMEKGVSIPNPSAVDIGDDVDIDRISGDGTVFYSGTKIYGARTLVCAKTKLGYEAPVTVVNCQLGSEVELKGGYFKESTFLDKSNMAYGAQVREGCILEEEANGSHTVGLKQTILFPFVTLGSLINFCDCFMAGGTSRKNHSEVGSSYIHFNYTPNQDKATASLIGEVPRGVMLDQQPIFLGGQGGLVGPVRIGYGTVIAAGSVYRTDCSEGGKLLSGTNDTLEKDFYPGFYSDVQRRVYNNICYLANLLALNEWYIHVRRPFFEAKEFGPELYAGAMEKLEMALAERLKRFGALSEKMEQSIEIGRKILNREKQGKLLKQQRELLNNWPDLHACFTEKREESFAKEKRELFLRIIQNKSKDSSSGYIETIQSLHNDDKSAGTEWLQAIVDEITDRALKVIPSYER